MVSISAALSNPPAPLTRRCVLATLTTLVTVGGTGCGDGKPSGPPTPVARAAPQLPIPPTIERPTSPSIAAPPAEARSPLTWLPVENDALVQRRIVAVKVDNAPLARPQFGLSLAEVVYEHLAEGGVTRFLAMYLVNQPERVGPVRSARLVDLYLGQEWDFLLAYAGAGTTTAQLLREAMIPLFKAPELGERLDGTPFFRDSSRPIPHNMFVRVAEVREEAARNAGTPPTVEIHPFPFQAPPADAGPLRSISVPYVVPGALNWQYLVTWRFDPASGTWKRTMGGAPHVDALTGQQIEAEDVLLQFAENVVATHVEPDAAGNPASDTVLRGEGRAVLFHSGQIFEGKWSKEHDRAKTEYRLLDGAPMPFRPGRVWVHILPTDFQATWSA